MKKINLILALGILLISTSCADSKVLNINGKDVMVEPYGWADEDVI